MDNFETLNKIIDFWIRNRMPTEQIFYVEPELMSRFNSWMDSIHASGGVSSVMFRETGVEVQMINYRGFRINYVDVSKL